MQKEFQTPASPLLEISVVICTYNRDKFIGKALECLSLQTLAREIFEIIIVDNNSNDHTAEICKGFINNHPQLTTLYYLETNKGLSFARNRGLHESRGTWVTYMDDDAEAVPGFLQSILTFVRQNNDVAGIGGKVIPKYSESAEPAWMNHYLNGFIGKVDFGDEPLKYNPSMKFPAGCNMTYSARILREVGGFNNQLTFRSDDKYIFHRVSEISTNIFYVPAATVYHNIDKSRLEFSNFKKLYLKTGNEEKIRTKVEQGPASLPKKLIEFIGKTIAAGLLYMFYLLKGQEIKGRYIFFSQWFTLIGFMKKKVFVR
jgi:glycosyltransferase involved in cell wall biosynthesis